MKKLLLLLSLSSIPTQGLAKGVRRFARVFEDKIPPEVIEFLSPVGALLGAIFTPTVCYVIIFLIILGWLLFLLSAIYLQIKYLFGKLKPVQDIDEEDEPKPIVFLRVIFAIAIAYGTGWVLNKWIGVWDSVPSSW